MTIKEAIKNMSKEEKGYFYRMIVSSIAAVCWIFYGITALMEYGDDLITLGGAGITCGLVFFVYMCMNGVWSRSERFKKSIMDLQLQTEELMIRVQELEKTENNRT